MYSLLGRSEHQPFFLSQELRPITGAILHLLLHHHVRHLSNAGFIFGKLGAYIDGVVEQGLGINIMKLNLGSPLVRLHIQPKYLRFGGTQEVHKDQFCQTGV